MTEPVKLYVDELRDYAVRDLSKLRVGDHVLSIHLPRPSEMILWDRAKRIFHAQTKTVQSVGKYTYDELEPRFRVTLKTDPKNAIVFSHENSDYLYATDAGVEPYPAGFFNTSNFILKLDELALAGISPILEMRPDSAPKALYGVPAQVLEELFFDVRKGNITDYLGDF